jgi:hypothetical protein
MAKGSGLCPWCGEPVDSIEHIIPVWLSEIVHGIGVRVSMETYSDLDQQQLVRRWETENPEYTLPVCDECNKWMNKIEKAAKRTLIQMFLDRRAVLNSKNQKAISDWAVMKALLWPSYTGIRESVGKKWLHDFYHSRKYPSATYVFAGRMLEKVELTCAVTNMTLPTDDGPNDQPTGYVFTLAVENLVLQVVALGNPNLSIRANEQPAALALSPQIFPVIVDPLTWPPTSGIPASDLFGLPYRFGGRRPN